MCSSSSRVIVYAVLLSHAHTHAADSRALSRRDEGSRACFCARARFCAKRAREKKFEKKKKSIHKHLGFLNGKQDKKAFNTKKTQKEKKAARALFSLSLSLSLFLSFYAVITHK
jgi:hypothetical protein